LFAENSNPKLIEAVTDIKLSKKTLYYFVSGKIKIYPQD